VLNVLLQERGGLSRAELARRVGLNRSSIGSVVAGLIEDGLVHEQAEREREAAVASPAALSAPEPVGRPGIAIEINPDGGAFIGVEIGIERLAIWWADLAGKEVARQAIPYLTLQVPPEVVVREIGKLVREVRARLKRKAPLRGLGVALPALVDKAGVVINGFVLGWRGVPLRQMLVDELSAELGAFPIAVENDANTFGVAALWENADLMRGTVACITMENGVGGGIFHDGQLFRGSYGYAGEFGHLLISPGNAAHATAGDTPRAAPDPAAVARPPSHLENHIGKDAVLALFRQASANPAADWADLLAAASLGGVSAPEWLGTWGAKLAQGLTQISVMLNPKCIVLGGSVAVLFPYVAERVRAAMQRELLEGFPMPEIQVSPLGEDGTPLGAALLMHRKFFSVDEPSLPKAQLG